MKVWETRELAKALGVHPDTIRKWLGIGCPRNEDGSFDVDAVRGWAAQRRSRNNAMAAGGPDLLPNDAVRTKDAGPAANGAPSWTDQYRKAKAIKETLLIQKLRGTLIERREVDTMLVARALTLKRDLMQLARRLAPRLVGLTVIEIQAEIEAEVRALLERYARSDEPLADPDEETEVDDDGTPGAQTA